MVCVLERSMEKARPGLIPTLPASSSRLPSIAQRLGGARHSRETCVSLSRFHSVFGTRPCRPMAAGGRLREVGGYRLRMSSRRDVRRVCSLPPRASTRVFKMFIARA